MKDHNNNNKMSHRSTVDTSYVWRPHKSTASGAAWFTQSPQLQTDISPISNKQWQVHHSGNGDTAPNRRQEVACPWSATRENTTVLLPVVNANRLEHALRSVAVWVLHDPATPPKGDAWKWFDTVAGTDGRYECGDSCEQQTVCLWEKGAPRRGHHSPSASRWDKTRHRCSESGMRRCSWMCCDTWPFHRYDWKSLRI